MTPAPGKHPVLTVKTPGVEEAVVICDILHFIAMPEANSFIRPDVVLPIMGLRAQQVFVHLGSGAGFYLIPAAGIVGPKGKSIGVDIRIDMLAEVENKAKQQGVEHVVQIVRANLENTPGSDMPAKSADLVLVANILHQSDPVKILTEAVRIVAANGHVAVIEWNTSSTPFGPPIHNRKSADEMKEMAASCGLSVQKEFSPSPYHYGIVFAPTA